MIRLARPTDAGAVGAIYAPVVRDGTTSFEAEAPTEAIVRHRIETVLAEGYPWLVVEDRSGVVGYAYASRHRQRAAYAWSVETSVYLAPRAMGRGLGTRLMRALVAVLTRQGFRSALAGVSLPNPSSIALHRKLGFETVGTYRSVGFKNGVWVDVWWGQLELPAPRAPGPPLPIEALRPDPLAELLAVRE